MLIAAAAGAFLLKVWLAATTFGSNDVRTLGLTGYKVTMRSSGAGAKIFDANKGQWLAP